MTVSMQFDECENDALGEHQRRTDAQKERPAASGAASF
eukprot:COSAG01_NODE_5496_length_4225_cov_1.890936_1_plen_38_part_00